MLHISSPILHRYRSGDGCNKDRGRLKSVIPLQKNRGVQKIQK